MQPMDLLIWQLYNLYACWYISFIRWRSPLERRWWTMLDESFLGILTAWIGLDSRWGWRLKLRACHGKMEKSGILSIVLYVAGNIASPNVRKIQERCYALCGLMYDKHQRNCSCPNSGHADTRKTSMSLKSKMLPSILQTKKTFEINSHFVATVPFPCRVSLFLRIVNPLGGLPRRSRSSTGSFEIVYCLFVMKVGLARPWMRVMGCWGRWLGYRLLYIIYVYIYVLCYIWSCFICYGYGFIWKLIGFCCFFGFRWNINMIVEASNIDFACKRWDLPGWDRLCKHFGAWKGYIWIIWIHVFMENFHPKIKSWKESSTMTGDPTISVWSTNEVRNGDLEYCYKYKDETRPSLWLKFLETSFGRSLVKSCQQ